MHSTYGPRRGPLRDQSPQTAARQFRRTGADFAVLFTLLSLCALLLLATGWQLGHSLRIYSGISVAGVPIGGLTRAAAIAKLNAALPHSALPALQLTWADRRWSLQPEQLWYEVDWLATVNQAYLLGRHNDFTTRVVEQLATAVRRTELSPELSLNQSQLQIALTEIAAAIHQPAKPATQIGPLTLPGENGVAMDINATVQQVQVALGAYQPGEILQVAMVPLQLAPTTAAPPQQSVQTQAAEAKGMPFRLQNAEFGLNFAIDPVVWRTLILSAAPLQLNEAGLRTQLAIWARQIDRPARDAKLQFDTQSQTITILQESLTGQRLDVEATVTALYGALTAKRTMSELVVVAVPPAVDSNRVAEMGIRELVASATSHFLGSSAERVHNIDVAAVKFAGVVIPPGGIFSFNDTVGDVSAANGFEDSLVIWGDQTVVGIGGGVCQVSTTVFRAAYNAGFSIVERYNHGYIVDWYGEPGLDATIYTPTVDFRFRNDNDSYLLIEPVVDHSRGLMTFNFYGTKPNRQVTLSEPVQTGISQPPPPEYRVDEALAPGQIRQVEWEKPGMQVDVTRTIVEDGATRTDTITSHYLPWRAVYLVGPGTEVPQPIAASE